VKPDLFFSRAIVELLASKAQFAWYSMRLIIVTEKVCVLAD